MDHSRHNAEAAHTGPKAGGALSAPKAGAVDPTASDVIAAQAMRIDQLLIRQTLIEEAERRRLGRALHDGVAQDLARVRAGLSKSAAIGSGGGAGSEADQIRTLDRVIESVRTLAFELSPPVLEDLGLCPALEWLGDHLRDRYDAEVSVEIDGHEPAINQAARTIVFRSVRELALNAAKHAPGSAISISCRTDARGTRVAVVDHGDGFEPALQGSAGQPGKSAHYGLLSVAQQIRGIGGRFEIQSAKGQGTRATIWLNEADGPEGKPPHA